MLGFIVLIGLLNSDYKKQTQSEMQNSLSWLLTQLFLALVMGSTISPT
jgi:hypothetical protein